MRFISFLIFITINLHFVNSTSAQKQWTLEACIQYAHQNNLQVQQVEYSGRVNEIYLSQSKAMRLPSLSANVNAGYNWGRTFDAISLSQREGGFYNGNGSLNLSMPIYKGGSLQNSIRQNRLLVESGNQDVAASK